ncbi:MAG TPA: hypothetical protein VLM05_20015, partial [Mycobacteriales bacterium]|nr:hypothetical protein [Mycobacteriales bacterium]
AAAAAAGAIPLFVGSGTSGAAPAPAGCPSNPSFDFTIPTPVGPPTTTALSEGGVGYAALGADKKLYYVESSITGDPLVVSPLACLGGQAKDSPAVVQSLDGTPAFFVTAPNGTIYQRYTTTGNFSSLGAFTPVNNATTTNGPAAVQTADGQYHLFVRGTNGALYHGFRQTSSLSSWRFESLGGQIVGPVSAIVDGSRVLVAAATSTGSIYTITGSNFAWGPWTKVVNQVAGNSPTQVLTKTPPSLVRDPESGAITMYAVHQNFGLFAISKPAAAGFTGNLWFRIDSLLPSDARIAAATDGTNSIVYARFLDRPSGQTLTAYTQFTGSSWSSYFLAPYTCFNCNPVGVDTTAKSASAKTKLSPGAGKMSQMPKTKKVLG